MADKHYNSAKDARVLDEDDDMDVDSDYIEKISPLIKIVLIHAKGCLREIAEPHHKDRKVNPVLNYYKKHIQMDLSILSMHFAKS